MTGRHTGGCTLVHVAAQYGHLPLVVYLSTKTPQLLDVYSDVGIHPTGERIGLTPLTSCALGTGQGQSHPSDRLETVRLFARSGCILDRMCEGDPRSTAINIAKAVGNTEMVRLLSDIRAAGGWRKYAAASRMALVRIRHTVSKTYKVLPEGHRDRELYHFLFGRNKVKNEGEAAAEDDAEAEGPALVLPDEVFRLVVKYVEGWYRGPRSVQRAPSASGRSSFINGTPRVAVVGGEAL